jgi:hypothetical protein
VDGSQENENWRKRRSEPAAHTLELLVRAFVPDGPIVLGVEDTIERRRGARIAARGI